MANNFDATSEEEAAAINSLVESFKQKERQPVYTSPDLFVSTPAPGTPSGNFLFTNERLTELARALEVGNYNAAPSVVVDSISAGATFVRTNSVLSREDLERAYTETIRNAPAFTVPVAPAPTAHADNEYTFRYIPQSPTTTDSVWSGGLSAYPNTVDLSDLSLQKVPRSPKVNPVEDIQHLLEPHLDTIALIDTNTKFTRAFTYKNGKVSTKVVYLMVRVQENSPETEERAIKAFATTLNKLAHNEILVGHYSKFSRQKVKNNIIYAYSPYISAVREDLAKEISANLWVSEGLDIESIGILD